MAKLIAALVLCDIVAHGLKAGVLLEATPETVKSLEKAGEVDPHKDAVAYARQKGAPVVRSTIELAAEQHDEAKQALLVEIAKLEPLLATAEGDTKAALEQEVASKRAALAQLG